MKQAGLKLVLEDGQVFRSLFAPSCATVIYRPGRWAQPRPFDGPLAVLPDRFPLSPWAAGVVQMYEQAKAGNLPAPPLGRLALFRCEFEPWRERYPLPYAAVWAQVPDAGRAEIFAVPPGTLLAARVKLIEEIEIKELMP